ncbi:MAG TPA: histidine triad nucleotide-binding protein [Ktedonobacteraceae bacterium]|jgi:histidine triad (HIT) family protein
MENCLFCKIAAGQIPSTIVYQDEEVIAFRDINPQAPQHILLIPRRHLDSMGALSSEDSALLARLFSVANQLAQELNIEQSGYRFVTNVGPDAGQSVLHLHFHLLGGRPLGWPPG